MTSDIRMGLAAALGAYLIWGLLPLYFRVLGAYPPEVILAHRVFWSVPTGLGLLWLSGRLKDLPGALSPRRLPWLMLSGLLIGTNWFVYIWAVNAGRVTEAALGYYINPLVNVAIGAFFLSERLRPAQWVAVALAVAGVAGETLALGAVPWIALVLCFTFAFYGLIRKQVAVDSRVGFFVEVMVLLPVLAVWAVAMGPKLAVMPKAALDWPLLMVSGAITATPLILFAIAARRLRLSTIGFIQYLGPSLQLIVGVALGEVLSPQRLMAFSLIWLALIVFSADSLHHEVRARRARAASLAPAAPAT